MGRQQRRCVASAPVLRSTKTARQSSAPERRGTPTRASPVAKTVSHVSSRTIRWLQNNRKTPTAPTRQQQRQQPAVGRVQESTRRTDPTKLLRRRKRRVVDSASALASAVVAAHKGSPASVSGAAGSAVACDSSPGVHQVARGAATSLSGRWPGPKRGARQRRLRRPGLPSLRRALSEQPPPLLLLSLRVLLCAGSAV